MNEYNIKIVNDGKIDFMPESIEKEIIQNVITICTTLKGSVPMDRALGVNPALIDEPVSVMKARISSEITEAIRKYEPRARVSEISFEGDINGKITPRVKVRMLI